jgi:homoserine O-acetyltransferase/O-succinyltransferase
MGARWLMTSVADDRIRAPRRRGIRLLALASVLAAIVAAVALSWWPRQRYADFGDFRLQSGETIHDLVVGYRTMGRLDASRSNAVLVVPWHQGTSYELVFQVGSRDPLVDTSKHFVILVDVLGNGVSSSPSNSSRQPQESFPQFSIGDMVAIQHRLITETFQLSRLRGVVGISMGGMQVFEWAVTHPDMMDRAVSIVGSPQSQADDVQRWKEGMPAILRGAQPYNVIRQAEAIMTHDVSRRFSGSMERAAAAIRSRLLVAGASTDEMVNPKPGFQFARLAGATILELDGRCGHRAPSCERATVRAAVRQFLD